MTGSSSKVVALMLALCSVMSLTAAVQSPLREKHPRATDTQLKPCKSGIVCDDVDDYPKMMVQNMIKQNINILDASPNLQHAQEIDNSTGNIRELCDSRGRYIPIRKALNMDGVWKHVLNDGNQYYYVEICRNAGASCNYKNYLPLGYTAVCNQKYVSLRLPAIEGDKAVQDEFQIPACCYCSVKSDVTSKRIISNKVT